MKTLKPASITITAESDSREMIEKLLEQALFEMRTASRDDNGFEQAFTRSCKGGQSGTMGTYTFAYERDEKSKNEFLR